MDRVTTLKPDQSLGDFRILRQLGRGGMGVVYLARDERLDRQVALKVIAPDLVHDPAFQERFETEARSAAAIEHPNAVPIYSAGSADGNLYIAMRYVEGTDLREYLAEHGPLSPAEAATVVTEVAAALDAAHAAGFVHRDVKPANILLTGRPGQGTAFLTDFGLTRGMGAQTQLTGTGQWIGTLDYVAPEQMAAGRVDARTDIYSLGCVLYEMLTGSVPYTGDEMQKLWRKANEGPPPLERGGSHAFDSVLARALAREPEQRYRSAGDLGRAASRAAGARGEAPTERSVATGVAAAGLLEAATPPRPPRPFRATPYDRPTIQMPQAEAGRKRGRSALAGTAIVICAVAIAGGLVTGALLLAGDGGTRSSTIVRKEPAAEVTTTTSAGEEGEEAAEATDFEGEESEVEASTSSAGGREPFYGSFYSVTVPAGWEQEDFEEWASDGSYIENTWKSPDGSAALKIDMSPGEPKDATESAEIIAEDLEAAGETVYAINRDVVRGGMFGTELAFSADSERPERSDFFFELGDNSFAVLGTAYDLRTAQSLVGPLVRSLSLEG
ncbi:MAG TPA: serine/threonine-protein kinase [Solirubrobacterales bacterium]|nr:serine/threonine-protein kinase [Solirubrobacterales bacterium]